MARRKVKEGVPEQPLSSVRDDEQAGGNARQQGDQEGSGDGAQAQLQDGGPYQHAQDQNLDGADPAHILGAAIKTSYVTAPGGAYGVQWQGTVRGLEYRLILREPDQFHPPMLGLERRISHPNEKETWIQEWIG